MLDIDWHCDSYRNVANFFSSPDSLEKFNSGDAGQVLMSTVVLAFLPNKKKCRRHKMTQPPPPKKNNPPMSQD